jgi:hypothetical protein
MLNTRASDIDSSLLQIKCALAALDVELKLCRLGYLLRKYSADQPRVPAGSAEGGAVDERQRRSRRGERWDFRRVR